MPYSVYVDLLEQLSEDDLIKLTDDEKTDEDLRDSAVVYFQCDTADTSGHFENSSNVAVTLGPGNTAEKIVVGVKFKINTVWYAITGITGDGEGDNEVAFSATLATATYEISQLASAEIDGRVTRAIEDADSEIDGYLSKCFAVPLSPVPDVIRKYSVDIALYNLYSRRNETFSIEVRPIRVERYNAAIKYLQNACKNGSSLGLSPAPAASDSLNNEFTTFDKTFKNNTNAASAKYRKFSRDKLNGF